MLDIKASFKVSVFFCAMAVALSSPAIMYSMPNNFLTSSLAAIIKIPPKPQEYTYAQVPCSNEDQAKIKELITTIGTHGKIDLLLHYKSHLEQLGDEVRPVHPLKFLDVIFSDPTLKNYMKDIYDDYFKWSNFINNIAEVLETESKKGTVQKYLPDFASNLHISPSTLQPFVDKRDWKNFVTYLIFN
jgi:hypothetical protein